MPLKLVISCAEASSDIHGAALVRALRKKLALQNQTLEVSGIGGPALIREGLNPIVDAKDLLAMGFFEIISRLPKIYKSLKKIENHCVQVNPDVVIVVDYPDFHFRLAKRLSQLGISVAYYIPPKVWVWRKKRIKLLAKYFKKIFVIFHFEKAFFKKNKLEVSYHGNPLLDELPLKMTQSEARALLGLDVESKIIAILPGSRPSELKRHLHLLVETCLRLKDLQFVVCLPEISELDDFKNQFLDIAGADCKVRFMKGKSHEVLLASDLALVKSGTATLEAAVLGVPQIIFYKPNYFTCFVFKYFIRYRGPVGLANLVLEPASSDQYFAPELLCCDATPDALSAKVKEIGFDYRSSPIFTEKLKLLQSKLSTGSSPSEGVAGEIIESFGQNLGTLK